MEVHKVKPTFNLISTDIRGEPERDEEGRIKYYGSGFLDWKTFGPTISINVEEDILADKWMELVPRRGVDFKLTRVSGDSPSFSVIIGRLIDLGDEKYCGIGWGLMRKLKDNDVYYIRLKITKSVPAGTKLFCNPRKGEDDMFIKPE